MPTAPRILVAPLDWGLGHATRCVPLIRELQRQGAAPLIGTNSRAAAYLQAEFPDLPFVPLPAYDLRYPRENMYWNLGRQLPRLIRAVRQEHRLLQALVPRLGIQGIISDNRFGAYAPGIPCVFITHQLNLPIGFGPLRLAADRLNHWFVRRYAECWIPDRAGEQSLAGRLATPPPGLNCCHLGLLSRLSPLALPPAYDVLALLSGPEPQRTRLEEALLEQLRALPLRALVVQGKPETQYRIQAAPHLELVSFLSGGALQQALASARLIVCRSGYSSLMDLAAMGKKALLIPTPGQGEQVYLARRLHQRGICPSQTQRQLQLESGLQQAAAWPGFTGLDQVGEGLSPAIQRFLARC
jgi:UDP:flavonoid glycosyltransferase YjiC (YdhE family)